MLVSASGFGKARMKRWSQISLMKEPLKDLILKELCSDGMWQLPDVVKSGLKLQIARLPRTKVSEDETRYPQSPAGMRAFFVKFFTRHYLQTQNSLLEHMTSEDFLETIRDGNLRILDVGSGPAVASLAITDILACILRHLRAKGDWPRNRMLKVHYILNDTSGICLGTGQRLLTDYFRLCGRRAGGILRGKTISIQKAFPDNMNQLRRIKVNLEPYDLTTLSYVVSPLKEDTSVKGLLDALLNLEGLCSQHGKILIVQDRFRAALMKRIGRALGTSTKQEESKQEIFPTRNANETYTYSYYSCLYSPAGKAMTRPNRSA